MRLIPVLDLKAGLVVRGVGGRRDEYRPVESVVARSADPVEVAISLRERFGFREFYIADLDAIVGGAPHADAVRALARRDFELHVDAGLRDMQTGRALLDLGATKVIAALETSPGPEHLTSLLGTLGADRVIFSLDLQSGSLLTSGNGWLNKASGAPDTLAASQEQRADHTPIEIAQRAVACGVRSLILLDLAGVGESRGVPTLELCRNVRAIAPETEIITGGGVRNRTDLEALEKAGADGVLIASALHNGALSPGDCAHWTT
ncbi:MAG: hypothetical protein JNG89_18220 [Planctomycetaceae bacterium]|nr:hypothetical protein [Planctomycetaceae bacterium]